MEIGIQDLASDFTLAQAFTAEQVLSLEKDFLELTERIKEELPLILNSYMEVASDAKGKGSLPEKFIRSAVDTFVNEVSNSDAWIFYSSLIAFNINNDSESEFYITTTEMEERVSPKGTGSIDFLCFIEDIRQMNRLTTLYSSVPWTPNRHDSSDTMDEITRSFQISKKGLVSICKSKKEEGELAKYLNKLPGDQVSVNYFRDPYDLKILEFLDRDVNAKAAMMRAFASYLIENIRDIRGEPAAKLKLSSEGVNSGFGEEVSHDISVIIERYIGRELDHYISESNKLVDASSLSKHQDEWLKLENTIRTFAYTLYKTIARSDGLMKALKIYLGDLDELMLEEIFAFLSDNGLNPCNIPTIAELGKYKGGYALVKSISEAGGLKSIRKKYVPWSIKKTRDLEERTKITEARIREIRNHEREQREQEKIMSLYASEAADPGSAGINMSLNAISDLMQSESEQQKHK